jgi:hypothetical protein
MERPHIGSGFKKGCVMISYLIREYSCYLMERGMKFRPFLYLCPEAEFLVILCKYILPEADLRLRPSMYTHSRDREKTSGQATVQYLNNMSHGRNLSLTSGEPEFVAQ